MRLRHSGRLIRLGIVSELRGPGLRIFGAVVAVACAAFAWNQGSNAAGTALTLSGWLGKGFGMAAALWFAYVGIRDQNEKLGAVVRTKPIDGAQWVSLIWATGTLTWLALLGGAFLAAAIAQLPHAGLGSLVAHTLGFLRAGVLVAAMATLSFALSRMMRSPLGGIIILFAWFCSLAGLNYIPVYLRPDFTQNFALFAGAAATLFCLTGWLVERARRGELRSPALAVVAFLLLGAATGKAALSARDADPRRLAEQSMMWKAIASQDMQPGRRSPGFWLPDGRGGTIRTRDYAGYIQLHYLFSAQDLPAVRTLQMLDVVAREYGSRGVQPIGICLSPDQGDGPNLVRAGRYRFPIGTDPTTEAVDPKPAAATAIAYRAETVPLLIITDRSRKVTRVAQGIDYDLATLRAWVEERLTAEPEWHP